MSLRWCRAAALLSALALSLPAMGSAQGATPSILLGSDAVLVVTINLQEAWGEDLKDSSEIGQFVTTLLQRAPYEPDVVLLQEVRRSAVLKTAKILTQKTGQTYVSPLPLAAEPWRFDSAGTWIESDTAILMNKTTMVSVGSGSSVKTPDPWNEKYDRAKKEHAVAVLLHRATSQKISFISLHLGAPPSRTAAYAAKITDWTKKIAAYQIRKHPAMVHVMGGDFNWPKNVDGVVQPFWNLLHQDLGYIEGITLFTTGSSNPAVDYIFSNATAVGGGSGPEGSYSNHRFFWSILKI
ncbi:MAG: hypothetical protein H0U53_01235 [Actinobacteria bacterium]|nr:hypothetical protein [Actinomycetota bacterium]